MFKNNFTKASSKVFQKRKIITYLLAFFLLLFIFFCLFKFISFYKNNFSGNNLQGGITTLEAIKSTQEIIALVPSLLGYKRPQTYLVLFLNNTEMRPGGGFIGSYGLLRIDKGRVEILETSGSENLDWAAPKDFKITPPYPISLYMNQADWFFRDSNWSPDFAVSAKTSLWFYRFEGGKEGSRIDGIIGITPTVVEKIMEITGPLVVSGKHFNADNFTEELEYHVEYGYKETGQSVEERKIIIGELSKELINKVAGLPPWRWAEIWSTTLDLLKEKQIMFFSNDDNLQTALEKNDWAGRVKDTVGDYLLVTDSNLASLKTDPTVKRTINYEIRPQEGRFVAKVSILYDHQGFFDWRTTRYRTYIKIYTPLGSELINSDGFIDINRKKVEPDIGVELGKTFFGGFLSVEPQTKKTLTIEYFLPEEIEEKIKNNLYTLFVQKQLGTIAHALTVSLDFGKTQGEQDKFFAETDLRIDRNFIFH